MRYINQCIIIIHNYYQYRMSLSLSKKDKITEPIKLNQVVILLVFQLLWRYYGDIKSICC